MANLNAHCMPKPALARATNRQHVNFQEKSKVGEHLPTTTLMIRHVPRRYNEEDLLLELSRFVEPSKYDFMYLPRDNRRSSNVGYGFVNFISADIAYGTNEKMNGASWSLVQSNKVIATVPAHLQGLARNLAHYADSRVAEDGHAHSPLVWANGVRIDFHDAVQLLCPPESLQHFKSTSNAQEALEELACSSVDDQQNPLNSSTSSNCGFPCDNRFTMHTLKIYDQFTASVDHPLGSTVCNLSQSGGVPATKLTNSVRYNGTSPKVQRVIEDPQPCIFPSARDCSVPSSKQLRPKISDIRCTTEYQQAWKSLNCQLTLLCPLHHVPLGNQAFQ